jgi:hypothetical protein
MHVPYKWLSNLNRFYSYSVFQGLSILDPCQENLNIPSLKLGVLPIGSRPYTGTFLRKKSTITILYNSKQFIETIALNILHKQHLQENKSMDIRGSNSVNFLKTSFTSYIYLCAVWYSANNNGLYCAPVSFVSKVIRKKWACLLTYA